MEPFVPERDERIGNNNRPQPSPKQAPPPPVKHAGMGMTGKIILFLLLLLTLGLGGALIIQNLALNDVRSQFNQLQERVTSTDASLNETGTVFSDRLQQQGKSLEGVDQKLSQHFSEIDKLWAARKKINDSLATAEKTLSDLDGRLKTFASEVKGIDQKIASSTKAAQDAESRMKAAASGLEKDLSAVRREVLDLKLSMEEMEGRVAEATSTAASLKQWQTRTDQRLANNEDAILAIDAFRLTVNSELNNLQRNAANTVNLDKIYRDIELLKDQHPYIKN